MFNLQLNKSSTLALLGSVAIVLGVGISVGAAQSTEPQASDELRKACEKSVAMLKEKGVSANCSFVASGGPTWSWKNNQGDVNLLSANVYKDFTRTRKIRVAMAAFMEPELVERTNIGYFYRSTQFGHEQNEDAVRKALEASNAVIAVEWERGSYFTLGPVTMKGAGDKAAIAAALTAAMKAGASVGFISEKDKFLGVKPISEVVTWSPASVIEGDATPRSDNMVLPPKN